MNLKDFVSTTLIEICEGIQDAQTKLAGSQATINPANYSGAGNDEAVQFDVAVVANEGTQTSAKAGIAVVPFIQLGAAGASSQSTASTSRIQFKVGVRYPSGRG